MTGASAGNPGSWDPDAAAADPRAPDAEAAAQRIRERAAEVRDRELETALAKLDARGECSAADRAAVEALAERLTARLVAVPERGLRAAADDDRTDREAEAVETALELFG